MSKIFFDTEFLEGPQDKRFLGIKYGQTKPTIDLISIAMVHEDGREYYAISKEFNLKEAWNRYDRAPQTMYEKQQGFSGRKVYWLRDNVLKPIYEDLFDREFPESWDPHEFSYSELKILISIYGKTNKQISKEICEFVCPYHIASEWAGVGPIDNGWKEYVKSNPPEFYGYYSAYDHVVFCWLFGKMIDLPAGFPMYTKDLKQMMDEKLEYVDWLYGRDIWSNKNRSIETIGKGPHQIDDYEASLQDKIKVLKQLEEYPKEDNCHNALSDAKWNQKLYQFLFNYFD